jgi:hypothetical protein
VWLDKRDDERAASERSVKTDEALMLALTFSSSLLSL